MMRALLLKILLLSAILLASSMPFPVTPANAVEPGEELADPELESQARALSKELRCLVCQNQSIDDSDADLAKDLRLLVRERLSMGDKPDEVRDYVVDRYGEFVLLKPRWGWHTSILWLSPLALFAMGAVISWSVFRKKTAANANASPVSTHLSAEEEAALDELQRLQRE